MSQSALLKVQPMIFNVAKATAAKFVAQTSDVNIMNEAPLNDPPYVIDGVKYGRPSFRLKRRGGDGFPESDAFWFAKNEETGKVVLKCIVEVYREEADVIPLMIRNPSITLEYASGSGTVARPFNITQSPFIRQTNILQDVHAELDIDQQEVALLTDALTNLGKAAVLKIKSELWWQPGSSGNNGKNEGTGGRNPVISRRSFNYNKLTVAGKMIRDEGGRALWNCKDNSEAQTGLRIIQRYRCDTEISIGRNKQFRYFLSNGKIPVGASFAGEDFLPFDKEKVGVNKMDNRWMITDGRSSMVNFDDDEDSAREALKVLKEYGADGIGYMRRPHPTFMYIKSLRALSIFSTLPIKMQFKHQMATAAKRSGSPVSTAPSASTINRAVIRAHFATVGSTTVAVTPQPQKLDLEHTIILKYTKDDTAVFGEITDQYEARDFKWRHESIIKNEMYTIYYRPTARPDTFYFLPQVFRIKVNEYSGEPKISIAMIPGDMPDIIEQYRIIVNLQVVPYFNPKAKKDLYRTLDEISGGKIKYCNLSLGGFSSASFELRPEYAGENAVFRGRVPGKIETIDPVNGFNLSVDCSLESFDFFKRELINGFTIGDIIFNLVEENENGETIISGQPIPVELDIRKLGGIKVGVDVLSGNGEESTLPKGIKLFNENDFPLTVKGTELTLLAEIGNTIYDADFDIGNEAEWPVILTDDNGGSREVFLNREEVTSLSSEEHYWTKLVCEPFGVALNAESQAVLDRLIDYASGDPQIWELKVGCPLFERWNDLSESMLEPYKLLNKIEVEIKNDTDKTWGVVLTKETPSQHIQMARSISDILKTQQIDSRKYTYRVRTHYILQKTDWTEWKEPESTAANFLDVLPQTLTS